MTDAEKREAARQFFYKWKGIGQEIQDDRSYWFDLLQDVLGVDHVTDRIEFQKPVANNKGVICNKIDAYIPETKVLIEQKSFGIDLAKPQPQHGNKTPYEQAWDYNNHLPVSEKARWIVLSNFAEIWVYDMEAQVPTPTKFILKDISDRYDSFNFLVNSKEQKLNKEEKISLQAGEFVGLIYDALHKEYQNPDDEDSLKSLNILCVRLVFCLYAEDAHIFGENGHMFHDYMEQFETKDMRKALRDLFKILNTPEENREKDPYDDSGLYQFPYVNGGLFAKEDVEIPRFTDEIRDILLDKASESFDWSMISPTIFGAVFESTINPETRRSGGMHYTPVDNIHKVIDPLFVDDIVKKYDEIFYDMSNEPGYTQSEKELLKQLQKEEETARKDLDSKKLKEIEKKLTSLKSSRTRKSNLNLGQQIKALDDLQDSLSDIVFFDPACGSGNFLTETYLSIRRIENKIIESKLKLKSQTSNSTGYGDQMLFGDVVNPIKVSISQFYGIEINDFAVTVAKTALWIAESQMMEETEDILFQKLDFLPLKTSANITEGNALTIRWEDVVPVDKLKYIIGNPPFVGYSLQNDKQKNDILSIYVDENGKPYKTAGKIDYVAGWYFKAAQMMKDTDIRTALVSTNSITQGEQVAFIWKPLYERFGIHIEFAHRTFGWDSDANNKAHVHCVIIGFSCMESNKPKVILTGNDKEIADNINAYLINAKDLLVESRTKPLCDVPEMIKGSSPVDGGNLFISDEEYETLKNDTIGSKYVRRFYGAKEYLHNINRWCLWMEGISPREINSNSIIKEHVKNTREFRLSSKKEATRKYAEQPTRFMETRQPSTDYILVPRHTSENRRYIPFGFVKPDVICGDANSMIPNATLYHFGVLISSIHMSWVRVVCGRIKSDYRYSNDVVYNNFPWPTPTDEQKAKIEQTAQQILDARALYPDSNLSDLYERGLMPPELVLAHRRNNAAVMKAYGFNIKETSEFLCVEKLMQMYQELTHMKL